MASQPCWPIYEYLSQGKGNIDDEHFIFFLGVDVSKGSNLTTDTAYRMQLSQTLELACLSPSLSRCGDAISGRDHGEGAPSVGVEAMIGESGDSGCVCSTAFSVQRQKKHGRIRTSEERGGRRGGCKRRGVQRGLHQITSQVNWRNILPRR